MCSEFYNNYTICSKIGEGTFSEVLKCQNVNTGQMVAVKRLKKQFKHLSEAQDLPELLVLKKLLPHLNILSLQEYIFDPKDGKLFMIFELMEMSLYDLIQSRKRCLSETRVKHMFYQILKGVDHLHSHGIFHRDIKPENILIKKTLIKLADLGSIRGVYSEHPYTEYISTRWYRAPECILTTGSYGPKMDIWACGCVYYELLTSKPLFPGANEIDQLTKIHQVTGTPNARVMVKIRKQKSKIADVKFAPYPCINFTTILPFTSDAGRELLKRMLIYDPDVRTNVRRLLEHRYFNDLRDSESLTKQNIPYKQEWRSPVIFGSLTSGKKPNPRLKEVYKYEKKNTDKKLSTNSWGPLTNTSKIVMAQSKSKPNIKVLPTQVKKKLTQSPVKPVIKKNISIKSDPKKTIKQDTIKAKSLGILPTLRCKQESIKISKTQINGSTFKVTSKCFLPPIPEQKEVM